MKGYKNVGLDDSWLRRKGYCKRGRGGERKREREGEEERGSLVIINSAYSTNEFPEPGMREVGTVNWIISLSYFLFGDCYLFCMTTIVPDPYLYIPYITISTMCVCSNLSICLFSHLPGDISVFLQKRGNLKGYVELTKVKVIEKVMDTAFNKPSFQVGSHTFTPLYLWTTI